ncbi:MAG: hypothetical protein GC181_03890 [Bacteroidetes bacterium]|nr:hypothetical protein [Bacteroidota bacterium]
MNIHDISWIRQCLDEEFSYPYFKDKYAVELLHLNFGNQISVKEVKQSNFSRLIEKPVFRSVLKNAGNGCIDLDPLLNRWDEETYLHHLTTTVWGEHEKWGKSGYFQVSRPEPNLVLQVNLSREFDRLFVENVDDRSDFNTSIHPSHEKLNSVGWVRMDLSFETNEVLIEEVQSDWIRQVRTRFHKIGILEAQGMLKSKPEIQKELRYLNRVRAYLTFWDELLLSAAIHFIRKQLGFKTIWYHTNSSGAHYKLLRYSMPPVSVYSKLPEKFGFQKVKALPELFIRCKYLGKLNRKAVRQELEMFKLEING